MKTLEEINPDHVNDAHGRYQLQTAAERYGKRLIPNEEDLAIALEGPNHELYEYVWDDLTMMEYMADAELVVVIASWTATMFIMSKEDYEELDHSSLE